MRIRKDVVRTAAVVLMTALATAACSPSNTGNSTQTSAQNKHLPKVIRLDYAYYSPLSLVLKSQGWADQTFAKEGIKVQWVLDQGSNTAIQYLDSNSIDFGTTAGGAAVVAAAKGSPIEGVYVASKPEWTALVVNKDSDIHSVADLKGKTVAATLGTDPYIFLVRALKQAGLSVNDVKIVNLQHNNGADALLRHQVDAWAGLDPYMAKLQVQDGAKLIYRNPNYNSYCVLNVRDNFAKTYPDAVRQVLELYERARTWTKSHPQQALKIVEQDANLQPSVAKVVMDRNDFIDPVPSEAERQTLVETGQVLQQSNIIPKSADVKQVVAKYLQPQFAQQVVK
ncbi:aliphatic sulfonate ABC transporter substrate-binding protein [Alicyclobacillus kakegawensis]|uniref:aliphatic sulfonate ABC transporter substrate-binding protein n=1 Tax=Alicyclobacillus kakegawensis TaxID=392012 RepID=UPI0009FB1052|nr:aliphatic sulfonate ABC transporter substrate-binding protein [Alicyclobacillus kakegawensis]